MIEPTPYIMPIKELIVAAAGKRLKPMFSTLTELDKTQTNMIAIQTTLAITCGRLFDFGTLEELDRSLWPTAEEIEINANIDMFRIPFSPTVFAAIHSGMRHFYLAMDNPLRLLSPEAIALLKDMPNAVRPPKEVMEADVFISHFTPARDPYGGLQLHTPGAFMLRAESGRFVIRSVLTKAGEILHENHEAYHDYVNDIISDVGMFLKVLHHKATRADECKPDPAENKRRRRDGLRPIPPYYAVDMASYTTAIRPVDIQPGAPAGGTHASPVMHERRGHWRAQHGRQVWVRSTTVRPDNPGPTRSHYEVHA